MELKNSNSQQVFSSKTGYRLFIFSLFTVWYIQCSSRSISGRLHLNMIRIVLDQVTNVPDNIFFNDRWHNSQSNRSAGQPKLISEWEIKTALMCFEQSVKAAVKFPKTKSCNCSNMIAILLLVLCIYYLDNTTMFKTFVI